MTRIPVTLLTGFLGAGKTTFLNSLIAQPRFADSAVIVNEFGEAGIDAGLVARADQRAFEMSTGCLCCTTAGDVRLSLLRLLEQAERGTGPSFDRMVIETTGLADPAPVLQSFMSNDYMLRRFALNGIVTLVDAVNGKDALARFEEARRQVAIADLVVITKEDLATSPAKQRTLSDLKEALTDLNPVARIQTRQVTTPETVFSLATFDPAGRPPDVREWLKLEPAKTEQTRHGPQRTSHDHGAHDGNKHGRTASAFCFTATEPIDTKALDAGVAALQDLFGRDLLRIKGLVEVTEAPSCPRVLHVVGHVASPPRVLDGWPEGIGATRVVVIVSGYARQAAPDLLAEILPELRPFGTDAHTPEMALQ